MANNVQYGATYRGTLSAPFNTAVGSAGLAKLWVGTQPANCGTADVAIGNLLATWTFGAAWGTVNSPSNGIITAINPVTAGVAAPNSGVAGHFRIYTSALVCVMQGTAGLTSGFDWNLTNTNISAGQIITFTSMSITFFGA